MSQYDIIAIVSLLGWLVIAGSALASYRLGWGQIARMALTWLAIFAGLFLLVGFFIQG
ncbi:MAG: hypothetical protein ACOCYR_02925 [Erythrobacter sp.]|uniref:hypothetical protein n=1 Tax=Erythrobacter sp. HL-111 TaxID=1798193 RepID=UPI0006D9D8E0|nr:hypothetical protein [Erythrobacter sp. HL-111]KPP85441.1 MAG: hypothetical protein HLUCCO15_13415 [Erythrobacteraceae bacterium HL-111]SDR96692.1 hypothetical protein SAMN04515621_0721 [Erythrobacter sp. HL-111]